MNRINKKTVDKIRGLRAEGYPYKKISKLFSLSPSTVYKYCSNIELNSIAKKRLKYSIKQNQLKFINKWSKPKKIKHIKGFCPSLIRVISHCLFDGCVIHYNGNYVIKYTNSSKLEVEKFSRDFQKIFGIKPLKLYKSRRTGEYWYECIFISKKAVEFLEKFIKNYSTSSYNCSINRLNTMLRYKKDVIEFLKCFWCDEGCIDARDKIHGKSKSLIIIKQLKSLHKFLGIKTSIWVDNTSKNYAIYINKTKGNLNKFAKIGFGEGIISRGNYRGFYKQDIFENMLRRYQGVGGSK